MTFGEKEEKNYVKISTLDGLSNRKKKGSDSRKPIISEDKRKEGAYKKEEDRRNGGELANAHRRSGTTLVRRKISWAQFCLP